ncbi:class I SAM-dependent methyltransferase [Austwickia chelonae]|uniref:class I SAM-dependent methyltransferase n=1 Tax=Austwickia chelonae TaxID=100225 RepID=UPI000E222676|nr:class I SAM-dependent methyltransferase [Austwickia chelonae]
MVGAATRGTTNPNRLRRCDRWLIRTQLWRLRQASAPVVVDLGFGASPVTTVELRDRLRAVNHQVSVVGIEIDPARVVVAAHLAGDGLEFRVGGFELPLPGDRTASVVRAFNVLRQYDEQDVPQAWELLCSRLDPHGLLIDGTCDEIGRRATWVAITRRGPQTLTISMNFGAFDRPSDVADRLPKALIHRNVPGERIHAYLQALDTAWAHQAPLASYGRRQRVIATAREMKAAGWPLLDRPGRWRLGELTVRWDAVSPRA